VTLVTTNPPAKALATLIERHGTAATLRAFGTALAARAAQRRRARRDVAALSDHLRRDLGLPPQVEPATRYWEVR
jgi:uncharacterized protein YjiS (DUF1127 family)